MKKIVCLLALLAASPSMAANDVAGLLDSLWQGLSHGPGAGADAERLRALFHPQARIYGLRYEAGEPTLVVRTAEEFIARQAQADARGFHEREIFRQVQAYEGFAQVLSTVESRYEAQAPQAEFVGINSLQLAREAGRWVILTLYYSLEKPGAPFPPEMRGGFDARAATDPRSAQFVRALGEVAQGWNSGDSRRAAEAFTVDALYSEPPDKQLYRGRQALFEFFGGERGRKGQMQMQWHHLAYDPQRDVGFGEFTFTYGSTVHGVAVVRMRDGLIANWREYWYESPLAWSDFTKPNSF